MRLGACFVYNTILFMLFAPTSPHAPKAEEDEGNTEDLTHIEEHSVLEIDLVLLSVFDKDAGSEDEEEAEAEEESRANLLRLTAVEKPMNAKEKRVAQSLV